MHIKKYISIVIIPITLITATIFFFYLVPIGLNNVEGNFYASKLQVYYKKNGVSGNPDELITLHIFPWNFKIIHPDHTFYTDGKTLFKVHFYDGPTPTVIKLEGDYNLDELVVINQDTVKDNENTYVIKSRLIKTSDNSSKLDFWLEKK